ncbi:MAG TPA: energy transducer TonB [Blastocatellia bacterium]|nr:energy transducer TonB [Blastocatellia bacterium]
MNNPVIQEIIPTDQSVKPLETTAKFKRRFKQLLVASVALHLLAVAGLWIWPYFALAANLRKIAVVDEDYDTSILIDFANRKLKYPPGYLGFRAPSALPDPAKAEAERRRLEEERRKRRLEREKREAARRQSETEKSEQEKPAQAAKAAPTPTPAPTPAPFGRINTRPIKEQIQRLYEAKKAGQLVFNENKLRIGVAGKINPDGSLSDYKVIIPSGNPDVDRAALAILEAVSESRALGPLYMLSSISMILEINDRAELRAVGFAPSEEMAAQLAQAATLMVLAAKLRNEDPSAKDLIGNIKVSHTGQRVQAIVSMPRQVAAESLARTMEKPQN